MDWWNLLPLPKGSVRYLHAKLKGGARRNSYATTEDSARRIVGTWGDADIYLGLNPGRRVAYRPKASDITHLQTIFLDIDPWTHSSTSSSSSSSSPSSSSPPSAIYHTNFSLALSIVLAEVWDSWGVPASATTLVDSGRGRQIWITHAPTPVASIPHLKGRLRAFTHAVARALPESTGCKVDTACSDLGRLARLPGSINSRTKREARILHRAESSRAPLTWLLDHPYTPAPEPSINPAMSACKLPYLLALVTWRAREFLLHGEAAGNRHSGCFAALASLKDLGLDSQTALTYAADAAGLCDPPLDPPELMKIWRNVYAQD